MMRHIVLTCSLALTGLSPVAVSAQTHAAAYWSDAWRGWHFYEDPEPDPQDRPSVLCEEYDRQHPEEEEEARPETKKPG